MSSAVFRALVCWGAPVQFIRNVEVSAVLVPLSVEASDLDAVVGDLSKLPGVSPATWSVSALE